jgi:hypothetical protein
MADRKPGTGKGLAVTLQVLSGIDLVLAALNVWLAVSAGWPGHVPHNFSSSTFIGFMTLFMALQFVVRCIALPLNARWAYVLTDLARRHGAFPVSPRWAWLGWPLPVAGLWMPLHVIRALNARRHRLVITLWHLFRLTTCLSGTILLLFGITMIRAYNPLIETVTIVFWWYALLAIAAIAAGGLGMVIVHLTQSRSSVGTLERIATVF